jgi:hypothetical protein
VSPDVHAAAAEAVLRAHLNQLLAVTRMYLSVLGISQGTLGGLDLVVEAAAAVAAAAVRQQNSMQEPTGHRDNDHAPR